MVSYVLMVQERLERLRDIVHENTQETQKQWYDRNARHREFTPGAQVLILLPTSNNKLLAEWRGPYPVVRKVSDVNYEVKLTDGRRRNHIFHVNMLREWHSPSAASFLAEEILGEAPDGPNDVVLWDGSGATDAEKPVVSRNLVPAQQTEQGQLFQKFADVLSSHPGRTQSQNAVSGWELHPQSDFPPIDYRMPIATSSRASWKRWRKTGLSSVHPANGRFQSSS